MKTTKITFTGIATKTAILLAAGFLLPGFLYAGGRADGREKSLTVYAIKGPTGVGMVRMFEQPPEIPGFDVQMEALAGLDLISARFLSGEASVGILTPSAAALVRARGRNVQIAAVIGTGMLSLLTSDPAVRGIRDLRGKTVEIAGQGGLPDAIFRRILSANALEPERDVVLGASLAYPEIALSLVSGRVATALLPEPFATMARSGRPDLRDVADVQQEWVKSGGDGNYPMTLLVVDGDFAAANPRAVSLILDAVRDSIEWVKANPADAGTLVEKHEMGLRADIVAAAVPRSNYTFIPAAEAKNAILSLLGALFEVAPDSVGGVMPDDGFFLGAD